MSNIWTLQEKVLFDDLVHNPEIDAKKNVKDVAEEFSKRTEANIFGFQTLRTEEAISRRMRRLAGENTTVKEQMDYATHLDSLKKLSKKIRLEEVPSYLPTTGKDRFLLSFSDLHLPFADLTRVLRILEEHKETLRNKNIKSGIVLNGDIMDQYSASHFTKSKEIPIIHEYHMTMALVKMCLSYSDRVFLVRGNHEKRLGRLVREKLPGPIENLFHTDLLARIANGEEINNDGLTFKLNDFKGRVFYPAKEPWYQRIGKAIFAHSSTWKSGPGATVSHVAEYFSKRYDRDEFDCLVHGHTHKLYKGIVNNRLLIEQGSMCGKQDYVHDDGLKMPLGMEGYTYLWQDKEGNTNFNDSHIIYLGSSLPKKKEETIL